jgi:hypothetical protein
MAVAITLGRGTNRPRENSRSRGLIVQWARADAWRLSRRALHPVEEALNLFGASQLLLAVAVLLVLIYRPKGLFGMAEPDLLAWIGKSPGRQPTHTGLKRQTEV